MSYVRDTLQAVGERPPHYHSVAINDERLRIGRLPECLRSCALYLTHHSEPWLHKWWQVALVNHNDEFIGRVPTPSAHLSQQVYARWTFVGQEQERDAAPIRQLGESQLLPRRILHGKIGDRGADPKPAVR